MGFGSVARSCRDDVDGAIWLDFVAGDLYPSPLACLETPRRLPARLTQTALGLDHYDHKLGRYRRFSEHLRERVGDIGEA